MSSIRLLAGAVRAAGRWAVSLFAVALVDAAVRLALPMTIGLAVDAALGGTTSTAPVLAVCALVLLATAAEMLREAADVRAKAAGALSLRRRMLRHLFDVGISARSRIGDAGALTRLLESSTEAATVTSVAVTLVTSLLVSIGAVVALFLIDIPIGLLAVAAALVVWLLMRWLVTRMAGTTKNYQQAHEELVAGLTNAVGGARTIRAAGTFDWELGRVLKPLDRLRAAGAGFWAMQRRACWQLGLFGPIAQVLALAVAGLGVTSQRITPGEMLSVVGYLGYAMGLLRQVAAIGRLARAKGSADRIAELLALPVPPPGRLDLPPGRGELRLRGIRVRAGDRDIVNGLDLDVAAGTSIAIVGSSGSGKSTLAAVVGGLIPPDEGTILLDGVPLCEVKPKSLRAAFGYGFERPVLLGATIAEAVGYADRPADEGRVDAALRAGAAAEFVARLPEGAHTEVEALRLSGGETQRLGLARALCRDVRVLVLDDAMSSVDTATEAEITAALAHGKSHTTRILIAHRMSVAARADVVCWMEAGRARAVAPHHQLLADPNYRALFRAEPAESTC
ncbi:ABC transporter ATP-binding protein [Kibdelosporangium persicum]|uniref:ABC transporter ATP-binding membrane translocator, AmfB n=1 Tax=Kibdelosporangium persicum TaxID=2698649 RepID=A0ABX2FGT1_9PSEU|nr:ABC transporter ATP-binding protein [Kibdelosporangium persicum]NRN70334.1 ABC transporter ATP-binding membrane translocator, AmfB [Kibdelosporangium persicum]